MAIKWIGNSGSHDTNEITHSDLLDGFDLLENTVESLYDKDKYRIAKLAEAINKRRKPISKSDKKKPSD